MGLTMLLGAIRAPLDHFFILKIFFINIIMLRCILKIISKYVIKKYFQIVVSMSKLFLSYFYATFK
jgi:hypothetical protein